jgi:crotonobetainyl-CoA:carnitine CoA-transferase CaiB-like acyl-CoA transferase
MGHPELIEDPRFATGRLRAGNYDLVRELVEGWLADTTKAEAADRLRSVGVPAAAVEDVDGLLASEQAEARQMILAIEDPAWGDIRLAGNPIKSSAMGPTPTAPAPALGEHTRRLLGDLLGLGDEELDALGEQGVV